MKDFKGCIIAEGLDDPALINKFMVYKAIISQNGMAIDYEGHLGCWHIYYVICSKQMIDELQPRILSGWYAHFWQGNKIIVVYHDQQFELLADDRSTWTEAIAHGRRQGIPDDELDFLID